MTNAEAKAGPHPRDLQMEQAAREVLTFMKDWVARYSLSAVEFLYMMNQISGQELQKFCLTEREQKDKGNPGAAG